MCPLDKLTESITAAQKADKRTHSDHYKVQLGQETEFQSQG